MRVGMCGGGGGGAAHHAVVVPPAHLELFLHGPVVSAALGATAPLCPTVLLLRRQLPLATGSIRRSREPRRLRRLAPPRLVSGNLLAALAVDEARQAHLRPVVAGGDGEGALGRRVELPRRPGGRDEHGVVRRLGVLRLAVVAEPDARRVVLAAHRAHDLAERPPHGALRVELVEAGEHHLLLELVVRHGVAEARGGGVEHRLRHQLLLHARHVVQPLLRRPGLLGVELPLWRGTARWRRIGCTSRRWCGGGRRRRCGRSRCGCSSRRGGRRGVTVVRRAQRVELRWQRRAVLRREAHHRLHFGERGRLAEAHRSLEVAAQLREPLMDRRHRRRAQRAEENFARRRRNGQRLRLFFSARTRSGARLSGFSCARGRRLPSFLI